MPLLNRAPDGKELEALIAIFLRAETAIINEIGRLRSMGNVDYHAVAALERVQAILRKMENDSWRYVPRMVEREFYIRVPQARRIAGESAAKHKAGYANAAALSGEQRSIVDRLVMNLMGEISQASATVMATLESALLGRPEADVFRRVGLEQVALRQAAGQGVYKQLPAFVDALRREGVTAFVDKAGRRWSLHSYCGMASRTTARQAEILAVLTADPEHDLYQISSHGTTCALCAPYEGRVYSKSGTNLDFPPLSAAFGKVDANGPDTLENSWLNIHPNCLHVLIPWTPAGRSPEEIQKIKDFSDPRKNPFDRDPRSQAQIEAYHKKEQARAKWLRDYRQWEHYRMTLGDKAPKTFQTFQKHKMAGSGKYAEWRKEYKKARELAKYGQLRYHEDGTIVVTDVWKEHRSIPMQYKPNAVVETQFPGGQIDRIFYNESGKMVVQIHSGDHGNRHQHQWGIHGEHAHEFFYDSSGAFEQRTDREITERERKENGDIL